MFANLGMTEILIIVFVVLILFGGKKIPELAKGFGKGIRQFKNELKDVEKELDIREDIKKITD
jgi:sec-independent protein translocase protein TatA